MITEQKVDRIVEAIDGSTMLGAAWDCLSNEAKTRFRKKLSDIIDSEIANRSQEPIPV